MDEYKIPESELQNEPETEPEKETEEQNTDTGILIKNGHVVDPVSGTDEVIDVFIRNNTIEEIGHDINVDDSKIILMHANRLICMIALLHLRMRCCEDVGLLNIRFAILSWQSLPTL